MFGNKISIVLFQFLLVSVFVCSQSTDEFQYSSKLRHEMRSAQQLREYHAKNPAENGEKWLGMSKYYTSNYPNDILIDLWFIGTPEVGFYTAAETGHNRIWVIDSTYPNVISDIVQTYNASASSTSVKISNYTKDQTGTTLLEGSVYTDNTSWLGFFNFTQSFSVINKATDLKTKEQLDFEISGLIGYAWNPNEDLENINEFSSPILNILSFSPNHTRVFSVWLSRDIINGTSDSVIRFFDFEESLCSTEIHFVPLTYYDDFSPLAFKVHAFEIGRYSTQRRGRAKVDTGLPVIFMPESPYKAVYNMLNLKYDPELHIFKTDCSNQGSFPSLIFTIGGEKYVVKSENYVMDIGLDDGNCTVGIDQSIENDIPWGFGNPFLREYCEHFDVDNQRLGFSVSNDL